MGSQERHDPGDDVAPLGARLRAAREAQGLSQARAAAELRLSRPLLNAMERGTREVRPEELVSFARIYGKPVSDLMRPTGPPVAIGARLRAALASSPEAVDLPSLITLLEDLADNYLDLLRRAGEQLPSRYLSVHSIDLLGLVQTAEALARQEHNRLGLRDGMPRGGLSRRLNELKRNKVGQVSAPVLEDQAAEGMPFHYRILATQLYANGEITEGQLASYLVTDIVGARRAYQRLQTHDVSDDGSSQVGAAGSRTGSLRSAHAPAPA
jgi:transcriptional regulator with XRE-family HTH domain